MSHDIHSCKTAAELFLASLEGDYEDDAAWNAVKELRHRNTDEVFELAAAYCRSPAPKERSRGLDVLGQLGAGRPDSERPHFDRSVSIAVEFLGDEEPLVVNSAAWALSDLAGEIAVAALIANRRHSDRNIRWAVACCMVVNACEDAIPTLLELMKDPDDEVRDWATFALGTHPEFDSVEIREAFHARLADPAARAEAIWGLVQRKDPTGLRLLIERLQAESWCEGDEMAAKEVFRLDFGSEVPPEELVRRLRKLLVIQPNVP